MYGHAMYIEKNRLINKNSGGVLWNKIIN
jgi:hypothetical protein